MRPVRSLAVAALLPLAFLAFGCGPAIPDARKDDGKHAAKAPDKVADDDQESPADLYSYDPKGKRDPFENKVKALGGTRVVVDPSLLKRPRQALQKFDIDQLTLKMTTTGTSSPSALILDPAGKAHLVHIGDFVGRNWGKVSHIEAEQVTITETIADQLTGRVSPEYIPLRMKKTDQEKAAEDAARPAGGGGAQ